MGYESPLMASRYSKASTERNKESAHWTGTWLPVLDASQTIPGKFWPIHVSREKLRYVPCVPTSALSQERPSPQVLPRPVPSTIPLEVPVLHPEVATGALEEKCVHVWVLRV